MADGARAADSAILLAMAIAVAPLIVADSLRAGLALGALAGLGVAPMISCQFSLVGALAPAGTATEAFTWHRAATVAGMAGGSALGIADRRPRRRRSVRVGCAGVALAALLALRGRRRIETAAPPSSWAGEPTAPLATPIAGPAPVAEPATLAAQAVTLAAQAVALAAQAVALTAE